MNRTPLGEEGTAMKLLRLVLKGELTLEQISGLQDQIR